MEYMTVVCQFTHPFCHRPRQCVTGRNDFSSFTLAGHSFEQIHPGDLTFGYWWWLKQHGGAVGYIAIVVHDALEKNKH